LDRLRKAIGVAKGVIQSFPQDQRAEVLEQGVPVSTVLPRHQDDFPDIGSAAYGSPAPRDVIAELQVAEIVQGPPLLRHPPKTARGPFTVAGPELPYRMFEPGFKTRCNRRHV